jgi:hypothetical protein
VATVSDGQQAPGRAGAPFWPLRPRPAMVIGAE